MVIPEELVIDISEKARPRSPKILRKLTNGSTDLLSGISGFFIISPPNLLVMSRSYEKKKLRDDKSIRVVRRSLGTRALAVLASRMPG